MMISIMGTRGIPARYGGFETLAEELSVRLAAEGHEVSVYCRKRYAAGAARDHKGVRLVVLPTIPAKYFDTVVHTFLSVAHNIFMLKTDAVLLCNSANALFIPLLRLAGRRVVINVDGLEWKRKKWNFFGRLWYRLGERLAARFADLVVTDSRTIERYYAEKFCLRTSFIPYGATESDYAVTAGVLRGYGLEEGSYLLYVGRLEPENNADAVIAAYNRIRPAGVKLAIVGDAPYSGRYIAGLRAMAGDGVVFCGPVYGAAYRSIVAGALLCVNATEVGGTHPAIVEAMAAGKLVVYNDVPENVETAGETGVQFSAHTAGSLEEKLRAALASPGAARQYGERARQRVRERYTWDAVTAQYLSALRT
ncbi:MAG TPA: DUF1972 domain-containing protein [bacterium]|nr:DUF1972 domain-containing protein [bacterium]